MRATLAALLLVFLLGMAWHVPASIIVLALVATVYLAIRLHYWWVTGQVDDR